ncbi:MAG: O-antigen ligase family protein [Planctomycetota bacterium]
MTSTPARRWTAVIFGIGLGLPITPMEVAGIPLMLLTLVALRRDWPSLGSLIREPFTIALLAWIAWAAIALAWSPEPKHGLDELANARWLWVILALWLAPHLARHILTGIAIGFVLMHASQATQLALQLIGNEWIATKRLPDRVSGWSEPAVAGSLLCAVLGLHLPHAVWSTSWTSRVLAALALIGIVATGTRGAWIVAAAMLAGAVGILIILAVRSREQRTRAIVVACAGVVIVSAAAIALQDKIRSRVDEAKREIDAALTEGNKHTSTGGRIVMLEWATQAIKAEPVLGVGTGGYRAWVNEQQAEQGINPNSQRVLDHAHNTYLHIGATQGTVGLAVFLAVAGLALRNAWPQSPSDAGVFAAILGLLMIGMFDTVAVNAQTSALGITLCACALVSRRPTNPGQPLVAEPPEARPA